MSERHYRKRYTGLKVAIGILLFMAALMFGAYRLLFSILDPFPAFFICDSVFALCFGLAMYQVMAQSHFFRREAVSGASTLKAVGVGVAGGLVFLAGGMALQMLYLQSTPPSGEFSLTALLTCVFVGAIMGGAVGATFCVPLLGNDLVVLFLDYQGVVLYFTGAIGGCVGAIAGAANGAQAVEWWARGLALLGAGLGGVIIGGMLAYPFIALFTAPFMKINK